MKCGLGGHQCDAQLAPEGRTAFLNFKKYDHEYTKNINQCSLFRLYAVGHTGFALANAAATDYGKRSYDWLHRSEHLPAHHAGPDLLSDRYRIMLVAFATILDEFGLARIGQYGFTV